jgi:type IV secretion system protein VirD4
VIAPGGAPGQDVVGWSPIAASSDDETADRMAEWMVESSGIPADPKSRPWNAQARKY